MFEDVEPVAVLERRVVQPEAEKAEGEEGEKAEGAEAAEKKEGEEKEGQEAAAAAGPARTEWLIKFSDEEEVGGWCVCGRWGGVWGGGGGLWLRLRAVLDQRAGGAARALRARVCTILLKPRAPHHPAPRSLCGWTAEDHKPDNPHFPPFPPQPVWVDEKYVSQEVVEDFEAGLEYAQAEAVLDCRQRGTMRKYLVR